MPSAALPGPQLVSNPHSLDAFHERLLASEARPSPPPPPHRRSHIRRRGSLEQGRALEALGHAVEYLMDSGIFHRDKVDNQSNQAAIQILMRLSRAVFEECPEVVPIGRRLGAWGQRVVARARRRSPGRVAPTC